MECLPIAPRAVEFKHSKSGLSIYIFRDFKPELLKQFPASNDEKYLYL